MSDSNRPERWRQAVRSLVGWAARLNNKTTRNPRASRGQAMVEYVLIAVLVSLAIVTVLSVTGPTIGNVFSNTVYNLLGQTSSPYLTLNAQTHLYIASAIASYSPSPIAYTTNTPVAPTCAPAHATITYAPTLSGSEGAFDYDCTP